MGVFDNLTVGAAAAAAPGVGASARRVTNDRPPAKFYLNIGREQNGRFVNIPGGIAVDYLEPVKVGNSSNEDWRKLQIARNKLLEALVARCGELEPGQAVKLNLEIELRRVADDVVDTDAGEFELDLSDL